MADHPNVQMSSLFFSSFFSFLFLAQLSGEKLISDLWETKCFSFKSCICRNYNSFMMSSLPNYHRFCYKIKSVENLFQVEILFLANLTKVLGLVQKPYTYPPPPHPRLRTSNDCHFVFELYKSIQLDGRRQKIYSIHFLCICFLLL